MHLMKQLRINLYFSNLELEGEKGKEYLIGKKIVGLVGRKFSQSPIITTENKGFEIF